MTDVPESSGRFSGKLGQTFTLPAVVDVLLGVAGYSRRVDILAGQVCEPAAGDGAIVSALVRELTAAALRDGVQLGRIVDSIRAYEIDPLVFARLKDRIEALLREAGIARRTIDRLTRAWLLNDDFLLATSAPARWIIGNPPYVRARDIDATRAGAYRARWGTMTPGADIYVAFIEAGLSRLPEQGTLTYLCPDNWMRNDFGRRLREAVGADFRLIKHFDVTGSSPFTFAVGAYPAVISLGRGRQGTLEFGHIDVRHQVDADSIVVDAATTGRLTDDQARVALAAHYWPRFPEALEEVPSDWVRLEDAGVTVRTGLATGCDSVFVIGEAEAKTLHIEEEVLFPACHARNLASHASGVGIQEYLLDPSRIRWGQPETAFAEAYLRERREKLVRRLAPDSPLGYETWRLIDRVRPSDVAAEKLGIPDIRGRVEAHRLAGGMVPLHGVTYLMSDSWDLDALGGVMISSCVARQVARISPVLSGGHFRTSGQYLKQVRVPLPSSLSHPQRQGLADAFLGQDRAAADAVLSANA